MVDHLLLKLHSLKLLNLKKTRRRNRETGAASRLPSPTFLALFLFALAFFSETAYATTRHYNFNIKLQNVTRLCHTKSLVSVNKQFPGPRILLIMFTTISPFIVIINFFFFFFVENRHGIRQLRSGWADGPAYITQCPIQTGQSYVYNFTILRSTLYGPIIILPKQGTPYPFVKPHKQVPIIFGEWLNADTEAIISQALQTGGGPNVSDAYTINGLPGRLYNCSAKALLQSHYSGKSNGVYSPYFPIYLKIQFNYTGTPPNNTMVSNGTKLVVLPFNTYILGAESHPLHLHGFNFFVVGQGFGNFDPNKDPAKFNLVDPVERNTVGVWFMHCHLEVHTSWGLKMAWIVLDGNLPNQKLLPPPADLPKCW
ncbi:hypothetical protein ACOSQ3_016738 [Xanthoceras sorbifolium]